MSVPDAWGLKYTEVLSLTWLAYKGNGRDGKWEFPNAGSTWNVTAVYEEGSFRAVLVTGKKTVLSFSGTDDWGDWRANIAQSLIGTAGQYVHALSLARSVAPDLVVGHSLGGGLASFVAIYGEKQAATINPAPLSAANAIWMIKNHSLVINYVAMGEALDILNATAINMKRVGRTFFVSSKGGMNPIARHGIDNMQDFAEPQSI